MALYATNRFPGDGTTTSYEFNFVGKYIARTHVKVYQEDNATKVRTYVSINDSNFLNDTTLRSLPVTSVGSTLVIYRDTPKPPIVDFVNGSRFTEYNLDLVARQGLFVAMEAMDAGGAEARQQLLDAIAVVVGLVDDATAAVSDATAAAARAAASAVAAQGAATIATSAKTAAEAANTAAQGAQTAAQGSASAAAGSASAASTSASNAANSATTSANSATTATTQAGVATAKADIATTKASEASTSANNAAASAASINPANFMTLANAQTVSGAKTFSIAPEVGNVSNPANEPGKALNWTSTRVRTILSGWGVQAGVVNSAVYMGWSAFPGGILAQVDGTPMGSVITTNAARDPYMIGALVFGHYLVGGGSLVYGEQIGGSHLRVSSGANVAGWALPGTWVCLGAAVGDATGTNPAAKTLFMRVA